MSNLLLMSSVWIRGAEHVPQSGRQVSGQAPIYIGTRLGHDIHQDKVLAYRSDMYNIHSAFAFFAR
jgi:hypothetical protein